MVSEIAKPIASEIQPLCLFGVRTETRKPTGTKPTTLPMMLMATIHHVAVLPTIIARRSICAKPRSGMRLGGKGERSSVRI